MIVYSLLRGRFCEFICFFYTILLRLYYFYFFVYFFLHMIYTSLSSAVMVSVLSET